MRVADFDFELPERLIALRPAVPRDSARLLVIRPGTPLEDRTIADLPGLLTPGDTLVFNDTRVIPAAFTATREARGAAGPVATLGINLHKRVGPDAWLAFVKGARRIVAGDRLLLNGTLACTIGEKRADGEALLVFDIEGAELDAAIAAAGTMPLPPYIAGKRTADERDRTDYQTIFAEPEGSVAAPTAGLHFTPGLLNALGQGGIECETVTLHVGAGTFLPVKSEDIADHRMHAETGHVSAQVAERLNRRRSQGGRIIPVGTTSLRLLESAAGPDGTLGAWSGETDIFITPGYRFRAVAGLVTNFHLPRSTLFMLVSALAGLETMRSAYAHAIANEYRFYSYGDACLILPP